MSSTVEARSSTPSNANIQSINEALFAYAKKTGIDFSNNPFAAAIKEANSSEAILELLQEREKAFKGYREGNRRLINCISPVVNIIQAFSGILGSAVSLVSHKDDPGYSFDMTSSGPLPTSKGFICWNRCPPLCSSL